MHVQIEKTPESDSDRAIDDEPFARGDRAENPERGLIKRKTEDVLEEQKSVKVCLSIFQLYELSL